MDVLYDLAMQGNMIGLEERADYLEALDEKFGPFARRLRQLSKGFEEDLIVSLIEKFMEEDK